MKYKVSLVSFTHFACMLEKVTPYTFGIWNAASGESKLPKAAPYSDYIDSKCNENWIVTS